MNEFNEPNSFNSFNSWLILFLHRQQPVEKCPVTLDRDAKVFRRCLRAFVPLLLELRALIAERLLDLFDRRSNQSIGFLDRFARIIDEARLDARPTAAKVFQLASCPPASLRFWCSSAGFPSKWLRPK